MLNKQKETIKMQLFREKCHLKELIKNIKEYQIIINLKEYREIVENIKTLQWILDNEDAINNE